MARPFASPPSANFSAGISIDVTKLLLMSMTLMIKAADRNNFLVLRIRPRSKWRL